MKATQSTESATFYAVANDETVDATFINQYNTSTIALQGTKEWQDWGKQQIPAGNRRW